MARRLGRNAEIEAFFLPPNTPQHEAFFGATLTTLYLLRQEAQDCFLNGNSGTFAFLPEDQVFGQEEHYRLFATAMVLVSGIDQLAKFASGDDATGQVQQRFETYLIQYGALTKAEATRLYKIRNALLHSFGLYDPGTKPRSAIRRRRLKFGLMESCELPRADTGCVRQVGTHWAVCVEHLFEMFIRSIQIYLSALRRSMELKKNFTKIFHAYGYLDVSVP